MRRQRELKTRRLLAGPYLFWAVSFIIIPLLLIVYYGLTDTDGAFTLLNLAKMAEPENLKSLGLALLLSLVSTLICLILAYPLAMILSEKNLNQTSFIVLIFILPMRTRQQPQQTHGGCSPSWCAADGRLPRRSKPGARSSVPSPERRRPRRRH